MVKPRGVIGNNQEFSLIPGKALHIGDFYSLVVPKEFEKPVQGVITEDYPGKDTSLEVRPKTS